jgi:hypothetical protein
MDLLDRYLQAVRKYLPWQRQDDIIAELRANLESQLEDKEADLGRPLTKAEAEEWLKQLGSPIQVAARYQPQRYLIGPTLFPFYWYVLRMAFTWCMLIYAIVIVVQMFAAQEPSTTAVLGAVLRIPEVLLTTATWVTLIFAVIEFAAGYCPAVFKDTPLGAGAWSPAALPPVDHVTAAGQRPRSYAQAVAEVIFGFIFLVWLLLIPQHPYLWLGPGAAYLKASPFQAAHILIQFYWAAVAVNVFQLGWRAYSLWRERWQSRTDGHIVMKVVGLSPIVVLLCAPDHVFVLLKNPALDGAHYGAMLDSINQNTYRGVLVVFAIVVLQLLWEVGRVSLTSYRKHVAL